MPDRSDAIEALVHRWAGLIRQAAGKFGLTETEHDEVLQDVRIRLWRAIERQGGSPDALLPGYAWQAASSAAIDLVRRRRGSRSISLLSLDRLEDAAHPTGPQWQAEDEATLVERMSHALGVLSMDRRVAVRLHLGGRSLEEIAQVTGWTSARARNLLYRGLADLRASLEVPEGAA